MKKFLVPLLVCLTIIGSLAFTQQIKKNVGAVGDVKYSVLPPTMFERANGTGWQLMDAIVNLDATDLKKTYHVSKVPDARGRFIRGYEQLLDNNSVDPYKRETGRQRTITDYQDDGLKHHTHIFRGATKTHKTCEGAIPAFTRGNGCTGLGASGGVDYETGATKGQNEETRPTNIALYVYIKVNE